MAIYVGSLQMFQFPLTGLRRGILANSSDPALTSSNADLYSMLRSVSAEVFG